MAYSRQAAQTDMRQPFVQKDQEGKHPQGVCKTRTKKGLRKSARLNLEYSNHSEHKHSLPMNKTLSREGQLTTQQLKSRKRSREAGTDNTPTDHLRKRPRIFPSLTAKRPGDQGAPSRNRNDALFDPIEHWRREQAWPKEYLEPDGEMSHLLAWKKSASSLRRKRSGLGSLKATSNTPSDQKPREEKSAPYQDPRYSILLETKGSYVDKSELDITDASKRLCRTLLEKEQTVPKDSLFHDDTFDKACRKLQDKNEARVIQDISRLIVPSAETFATFGAKPLNILVESVNEGWNNSIPLVGPRPQPDYAVGFRRAAFTEDQLSKIKPILGDVMDLSFFMATYYMYFPFLTCEVKCGAAALDVADRQNAHSMTLSVRAIVELFRLVKREQELHRQILAFSISHDHRTVRIYGHYPVMKGKETTFYRHPIRTFDFTELDGKEKWTAYKFTKNVYDIWMPMLFDMICSAIDQLPPDFDFEVPLLLQSGLSQDPESHHLSRLEQESLSEDASSPDD
ncbi:uncharacterized protein BDCG_06144 [Blastomyces dermatitidis ER-3]|uniref:DUF7924 domain-containing protein n=1 Tax=Ajellomyces dermatitidis (strain ER-3 / ATCC MYA-2586) TaxID=559297 RepID=A0ABP2F468_AJEDR|nr:uncharacterized protein BDCG_06144 [Blastomyces dermatitidis ER-3]EEQ91024.2 hypothetical protein BDCG_06144 [Blastomyces dermatitidis ER-3]